MMTIQSLAAVAVAMCAMVTVANAFLSVEMIEFLACTSTCSTTAYSDGKGCSWGDDDDYTVDPSLDTSACDACYSACGSGTMVQASAAIFATFAAVAALL